jgi:predicted PurR-regulated permease PerM
VRDRLGAFLREKTPRRFIAFGAFGLLVYAFRELFILLVFFVAFQRLVGAATRLLVRSTSCSRRVALLAVVGVTFAATTTAVVIGAKKIAAEAIVAREHIPERVQEVKETALFQQVHEHLPGIDKITENAGHYATDIFHGVALFGHVILDVLIGFILAIVFSIEEHELEEWKNSLDPRTLIATLVGWFTYLADAISVTLQLQVIVAACNTALTLPVLFMLEIPHKVALMILIFASGLIPVIGNIVSGTVLSLLAFHARGWLGVGIFVVLTFVLHKLEAYYLNPHLTARHVKLPGFILVLSLLLWEHLVGFAGLFLSFPFLYVAGKIRADFKREDSPEKPAKKAPLGVVDPPVVKGISESAERLVSVENDSSA